MRDMKDRNSMESRQGQYSIKSEVDGTEVDGWMDKKTEYDGRV